MLAITILIIMSLLAIYFPNGVTSYLYKILKISNVYLKCSILIQFSVFLASDAGVRKYCQEGSTVPVSACKQIHSYHPRHIFVDNVDCAVCQVQAFLWEPASLVEYQNTLMIIPGEKKTTTTTQEKQTKLKKNKHLTGLC